MIKFKSILTLLESVGVEDIEIYETCSSHIVREMVIMLSDLLKEKLISNTEKAGMYALIIDEVTDISNMQQLLTFVKYHIINTGEPKKNFYILLTYFQNRRKQIPMQNQYLKA